MQHYEYVEYIDYPCKCNPDGSENNICNKKTGDCTCQDKFICGQNCDQCCDGYYAHPNCQCEYFNNSIYFMDIYMSDENHGTAIFQHVHVNKRVLQVLLVTKMGTVDVNHTLLNQNVQNVNQDILIIPTVKVIPLKKCFCKIV